MRKNLKTQVIQSIQRGSCIVGLGIVSLLLLSSPAFAHHPLDGRLPANMFEGLFSGLAHPVIGIDHLAFVIAAGLVGALMRRGIVIPIAFVLASLGGTGLHLWLFNLPAPEFMISVSILLFGLVLAVGKSLNLPAVAALGMMAGLFHGYAYGEAVVGADMTPLVAYLVGFATIQLSISLGAWVLGESLLKANAMKGQLHLRFMGFALCGVGAAVMSGVVLG
ncbi:MAG: urease accessory protein [Phormidesmis priestleyi Ana]|uniref:Urease accessory protein n=1 Tax=Phormidesmis priestleyi Ana TaxID=1666911 RepID=A0A0P7YSJ1_9CYAN|nr:MAG: urease accessory protein [Phormidesmis priestleyi Ana]